MPEHDDVDAGAVDGDRVATLLEQRQHATEARRQHVPERFRERRDRGLALGDDLLRARELLGGAARALGVDQDAVIGAEVLGQRRQLRELCAWVTGRAPDEQRRHPAAADVDRRQDPQLALDHEPEPDSVRAADDHVGERVVDDARVADHHEHRAGAGVLEPVELEAQSEQRRRPATWLPSHWCLSSNTSRRRRRVSRPRQTIWIASSPARPYSSPARNHHSIAISRTAIHGLRLRAHTTKSTTPATTSATGNRTVSRTNRPARARSHAPAAASASRARSRQGSGVPAGRSHAPIGCQAVLSSVSASSRSRAARHRSSDALA